MNSRSPGGRSPSEGPSRPSSVPLRHSSREADSEDEDFGNATSTSDYRLRPAKRRRRLVPRTRIHERTRVSLPESVPSTRSTSPIPEPSPQTIEDSNHSPLSISDAPRQSNDTPPNEDSVDLTDEEEDCSALADVLSRQRQDAVLAQTERAQSGNSGIAGHLFCHKCIIDTLRHNEVARPDGRTQNPRGTCPACRKSITGNDLPGRQRFLIPLEFKLSTRPRK
ncbi:SUMO-targeted ubiquitin ligase complex subunit slx8 [Ascosphaera aggregata]|nr:SUMO-targeted ubiquitin ligase complex subunit slx8 [Ascosphaera aggregata]